VGTAPSCTLPVRTAPLKRTLSKRTAVRFIGGKCQQARLDMSLRCTIPKGI
jgi:hypothetical protein